MRLEAKKACVFLCNSSPGAQKPCGKHPLDGERFLNKNKEQRTKELRNAAHVLLKFAESVILKQGSAATSAFLLPHQLGCGVPAACQLAVTLVQSWSQDAVEAVQRYSQCLATAASASHSSGPPPAHTAPGPTDPRSLADTLSTDTSSTP